MTSSSEIINGRYGELTLDGKKYQYDKSSTPNTWKIWDHETSDWVAAVNPLGDIADSGAAEPVPGHLSKSGKGILTARFQDWRQVVGVSQSMADVEFGNDDETCIMYDAKTTRTFGKNQYAIMKSPTEYKVISLLGIQGQMTNPNSNMGYNAARIRGIKWVGTRWVMLFSYSTKLYFIWSDDGEAWEWPPNNPTGNYIIDAGYGIDSYNVVCMQKGNVDNELMVVYKTASTTYKTIYSSTGFNVDDGANETNSATHVTPQSSDRLSALIKVGAKWIIFFTYIYNSSSSYQDEPEVTNDNGVSWATKQNVPNQSYGAEFNRYMLIGERLVVYFRGATSQGGRFYYTDDCAETAWKQMNTSQKTDSSVSSPIAYGYTAADTGDRTQFSEIKETDGVFYLPMNWLDPITATSGTADNRYITGLLKDSIEDYENVLSASYRSLKYSGFNDEDTKDPFSATNSVLAFDQVFRFKEVWFGIKNYNELFYI